MAQKGNALVLSTFSELWENIYRAWPYLNIKKRFELFIPKGQIVSKRLLYMNPRDITVTLKPVSNMENVIEIKSGLLHLGKEEKDFIKLQIKAPLTACKIHVKVALIDETDNPAEGMEFELIVNNQ